MVRSLGLTSLVKCNKQAVKDDWWCNIFKREQKHHQNQKQQKEQTNKQTKTNQPTWLSPCRGLSSRIARLLDIIDVQQFVMLNDTDLGVLICSST